MGWRRDVRREKKYFFLELRSLTFFENEKGREMRSGGRISSYQDESFRLTREGAVNQDLSNRDLRQERGGT